MKNTLILPTIEPALINFFYNNFNYLISFLIYFLFFIYAIRAGGLVELQP